MGRQRDPRSLLELRRLAYKAKRGGGWQVLHDALLETFPKVYGDVLQRAQKEVNAAALRNLPSGREGDGSETDQYVRYVIFRPAHLLRFKSHGFAIFLLENPHEAIWRFLDDVAVARVTAKAKGPVEDPVMFRRDRDADGEVFALLVGRPAGYDRYGSAMFQIFTSGGHTEGTYSLEIARSRPATPAEYASLERAMTRAPYNYNLRIVRRRPS